MKRVKGRTKNGLAKRSFWNKVKSWWLGQRLRSGRVPRGRVITSAEAKEAIDGTIRGHMTEMWGLLSLKHIKCTGEVMDYGLVDCRKITTAFRDYMVDSMQDSSTYPLSNFKYHASGTSSTSESNTQTALVAEAATRASGSQLEGATSDIFKTVGTVSYTGTFAIQEHGLFSANSGGVMMDRSVFATVNVGSGDAIEFTYEATFNAEA